MNTVNMKKKMNDTMGTLSTYLRKPNAEVCIMSSGTSIYCFSSLIKFEVSKFLQNYFKTRNTLGAKAVLIKALACPGYFSFTLIWVFFSVLDVISAKKLKMPLGVDVKVVCICVILPLRYFEMLYDGFKITIYPCRSIKVKVMESVCCDLRYIIQLIYWGVCVWSPYFTGEL